MKKQANIRNFRIGEQVVDARGIRCGGPTNHTVNFVSLAQEKLGQIATVLASDTGNESFFHAQSFRLVSSRIGKDSSNLQGFASNLGHLFQQNKAKDPTQSVNRVPQRVKEELNLVAKGFELVNRI